ERECSGALAPCSQILLPAAMSIASLDGVLSANKREIRGVLPIVSKVRQTETAVAGKTAETCIAELRERRVDIRYTMPEALNACPRCPVRAVRNNCAIGYLISDARVGNSDVAQGRGRNVLCPSQHVAAARATFRVGPDLIRWFYIRAIRAGRIAEVVPLK